MSFYTTQDDILARIDYGKCPLGLHRTVLPLGVGRAEEAVENSTQTSGWLNLCTDREW